MRTIQMGVAAALAAATVAAQAADSRTIAECFDGVLPEATRSITDTEIGRASWSTVCSDDCGLGCCDEAGSCCGDDCCDSVGCCGSTCSTGCCCLENCGLLGQGILTYDACSDGCPLPGLLLGKFFCKSERGFDNFVSPMTNPIFFEDPRHVTELRTIFWQHNVPEAAGGGDVNLYALQVRARLSENVSLIAAKDGYIVSTNPLIDDGWADVDVGLKFSLLRDVANQRLVSAGVVYDMPVGTPRTLQAKGDGEFHLFVTGGTEILDCGHWISAVGGIIPVDDDASSHFMYWSNHWDYQVRKGWYGVAELNWFHWTDGGDNSLGLTGVEGFDAFNLGSGGVDGNDIVTGALGAKYKPNRTTEVGFAYEVPLTERRDIIDSRLTVDLILRY